MIDQRWSLRCWRLLLKNSLAADADLPQPLKLTAQEDHRKMMELLGSRSCAAGRKG